MKKLLLLCIMLLSLHTVYAQTDFYWSGNSSTTDNIDDGANWYNSGNTPSHGDNLYFNNTGNRHWPYSNYGTNSWFNYIITYNGARGIKWRGDKTEAMKFENNSDPDLFEIESPIENRLGNDMEINPVGGGGILVSGSVTIDDGQVIHVWGDNGNTLTFNGIISGGGGIVIEQNSNVILNATNFYTGTTTISAGIINLVGSIASSDVTVNNGGALIINGIPSFVKSLTVNPGGTVIIKPGKALTVNGTFTNNAGNSSLIIQSDATGTGSLIVKGSVTGGATVQRYIAAYTIGSNDGWHLLASPVDNMTISNSDFDPVAGNDDLYEWDESTNMWLNYNNGTFGDSQFLKGKGYLVAYKTTATKSFTGTLNNANVPVSSLSKDNNGWQLLGNPFSCALLWNNTTADWNLSDVNETAKIWNESNASYTDISAGGVIPAMQGFMVQATASGASLTIPLSDRTHSSTAWYKDAETNKIKLTVYDTEGNTAQESIIKVAEDATTGFDTQYDSHFLKGYAPQFYSVVGDDHYSTNTIPRLTALSTIPFNFIKNSSSSYYIKAEGINSITTGEQVYLTDLKTNHTQLLNDNPVYYFTAEDGDVAQRFELHINGVTAVPNVNQTDGVQVFAYGKTVYLHGQQNLNGNVSIFNTLGQQVYTGVLNGAAKQQIRLNQQHGVYFVRLKENNRVITKKIFIQ